MFTRLSAVSLVLAAVLAGCVSSPGGSVDPAAAAADGALAGAPLTDTFEGSIQLSYATPARSFNSGGAFTTPVTINETITGFVVEVVWDAATPASEQLSVWIRTAGAGAVDPTNPQSAAMAPEPIAKADGPSPLRLVLPADVFTELGDYDLVVRASAQPVGVAAEQPFSMHITTFDGVAFDEAFTAVESAEE